MSEKHLLRAVAKSYRKMTPSERTKKIRKLVAKSKANETFIRREFPDFYEEAFSTPSRGAGAPSESDERGALDAKPA